MRGADPQYYSGTVNNTAISPSLSLLNTVIPTAFGAYQPRSTAAWALIYSSSTQRIYQTWGNRSLVGGTGDTRMTVVFTATGSSFTAAVYTDYHAGSLTGNGHTAATTITTTGMQRKFDWRILINEYEFVVVIDHPDVPIIAGGVLTRDHVTALARGVAFTTGAVSVGSNVVVPVDRNLVGSLVSRSNVTGVGQRVWLQNVTIAADGALRAQDLNATEVVSVAASTVTIASVSNAVSSGAILGVHSKMGYVYDSTTGLRPTTLLNGDPSNTVAAGYYSERPQWSDLFYPTRTSRMQVCPGAPVGTSELLTTASDSFLRGSEVFQSKVLQRGSDVHGQYGSKLIGPGHPA